MKSIRDIYESISARDAEYLEKQAAMKLAEEEEDAAGRLTARGFANEALLIMKMANLPGQTIPDVPNDLGAVRNYKVGPQGATGTNAQGQKVRSGAAGFMQTPPAPKSPSPAGRMPK